MIEQYSLPSLFLTLSMAEGKWTHLKHILKSTDNKDTLPTNRPLHTTLFFVNFKQHLKNHIWKKPANSRWGQLLQFFERVEFQNRGAAHTHTCISIILLSIHHFMTKNEINKSININKEKI